MEQKNEDASSYDMNSEGDICQDTIKVVEPRRLTQVIFQARFPPWKPTDLKNLALSWKGLALRCCGHD